MSLKKILNQYFKKSVQSETPLNDSEYYMGSIFIDSHGMLYRVFSTNSEFKEGRSIPFVLGVDAYQFDENSNLNLREVHFAPQKNDLRLTSDNYEAVIDSLKLNNSNDLKNLYLSLIN